MLILSRSERKLFMDHELMVSHIHVNPMRAHGAWIYLFASVGAGAIVGADHGVELALLVGTGFIGAFQIMSAVSLGQLRHRRQLVVGVGWVASTSLVALGLGADPGFLAIGAFAMLPGIASILLKTRVGFLARSTLVTGIAALSLAAPVVAVAGGASVARGAALYSLLWPYFCWRTLRVAAPLQAGAVWDREQLKRRGLREAGNAALWSAAVAVTLRVIQFPPFAS